MSPTQLSKRQLVKEGYLVEITEHWNAFARVRKDLFDFIDLLGVKEGELLGIQTTSASNMNARIKKILEHPNYKLIKSTGLRIVVHGWFKNKSRRWELKSKEL